VLQGRRKRKYAERLSAWILRAATEQEDSRVSVVSTNYDTTVERPLFKYLIRHGVSVGRVVDLGMSWRDASRPWIHVRPARARLAFLKLHGSLNWLRCELCGHVTVNVSQRIGPLDNWETRSSLGYNVCWCGGLLRSILVTPSIVRDVRDANLLGIWGAALEDLRLADEWVFVGYSLPTEDIAIRSLLLRAWHARRRKNLRVRVIQFERPDSASSAETDERGGLIASTKLKEGHHRKELQDIQYPDPRTADLSETYKRYRLFFPSLSLKEANYRRDGLEPFVDGLDVLSESKLHACIRRRLGGRTSSEIGRHHAELKRSESERKRARQTRR
jgi:hypothetical protein